MEKERFSLIKRLHSFKYAFNGILKLFKSEHNAKVHLFFFVVVVVLGFVFKVSKTEWIFIIFASGLVFVSEIINTAIEKLCDFIEPNQNSKIGLIKDFSAGAVLISAIISAIVGSMIFVPKVLIGVFE